MSRERLKAFKEMIQQSNELQQRIKNIRGVSNFENQLVLIGGENGYIFTIGDVEDEIQEEATRRNGVAELEHYKNAPTSPFGDTVINLLTGEPDHWI
ncbi:Nif11-like leader peptide family natural product precursor [Nostoc sp.]|uniref:Nif11-like leader peptide family natural product precursor n=1 Tax=Nostoc sp. TaxID=1180 RepID=UPI002FF1D7EE